ncbi:hypothetical protein OWR28_14370 [Chryseobacterium sp. 1B4]
MFLFSILSYGQVGINNNNPRSTLDVASKTTDGSTSEGFILPRINGNTLKAADTAGVYGEEENATLVFVTIPPDPVNRTGQVEGMDVPGFYYFDAGSNRWVKIISSGTTTAYVTQLLCSGSSDVGILQDGQLAAGVNTTIPYNGGNGGIYSGISINSINVTGLTAVLASGTLNNGNGSLIFNIIGSPSGAGTATFNLDFAGESCSFSRIVQPSSNFPDVVPVIINGETRQMKTHNLGADSGQDPNTPSQSIIGNYYQWGKNPVATAYTNANSISGWNTSAGPNKAWNSGNEASPVKTVNDPCPDGFRIPTRNEWVGFANESTANSIGTWATTTTNGPSNYSAAKVFTNNGSTLTFPTAGNRQYLTGSLERRAYNGLYWSTTESSTNAYDFNFTNTAVIPTQTNDRKNGFSIRCISQ